jgi:hypothetical protein
VDCEVLATERDRFEERLGPGDIQQLLSAIAIYGRFTASGAEVFENARLLGEGMASPPRFTSYLPACATLPPHRGVYEQMLDDQ